MATVATEAPDTDQEEVRKPEGQEDPVPPLASSSSFLDEAMAGASTSGPPPVDHRAHKDLLQRIACNMGLQAEEVVEPKDPMVDILPPSQVALPLIKAIQSNIKTLWQTPPSIPPTARGVERKYFIPCKGYKYLFSHPQPCSLVVSVVNQKERQAAGAGP